MLLHERYRDALVHRIEAERDAVFRFHNLPKSVLLADGNTIDALWGAYEKSMIQIEHYRIQERMASMEDLNTVLSRRLSELDAKSDETFSVSLIRRGTVRVMAGSKDAAARAASSTNPYNVDWEPGYSCIEANRLSPSGPDPDTSVKSLGLSTRVANALARSGIKTLGQLDALDRSGLKRIRCVSIKSVEEIEKLLAQLTLQSEERN